MNLNEELQRIKEIMQVDEMAYPTNFSFEEYGKITSFAGKLRYAQERLLGKVGAGSGRAVFRVDDEKVMKVAMNSKGVAQNSAESDWGAQQYEIVAKVFDADPDDAWVEMELAKKINEKRFIELTGVSLEDVRGWLMTFKGEGNKRPREYYEKMNENDFIGELTTFTQDYGYPVPGDFATITSYGEVLRDGRPTVVLIDFGYNQETDKIYTASQQRSLQRARQRQSYYY